ncbi:MAG: leucine-rich repeat protein [Clostridiales bacterium]|nr:leucine-rich repeat protein [Clostridiales bacterium]
MIMRLIASLMLSASFLAGLFPFAGLPGMGFPGVVDMKVKTAPASFDSYELTLADGVTVDMSISGDRMIFDSSKDRTYDIALSKCSNSRIVRNFTRAGGVFDVELASSMTEGELYYLSLTYDCYGRTLTNSNNVIYMSGDEIFFWRTANYEYNLGTCSEMWTDEQSLKECLEPQNDIECDDPVLIAYSNQICEGASDDWEKAFRIYTYIAHEMAYDNIEADGDSKSTQDGAVDILRDGKGICEGLSNAMVALLRAQGIPAVVEFGLGYGDYEQMTTREYEDGEYADHAWAAVFLGGKWHFLDPTYDIAKQYNGPNDIETSSGKTDYYLLPLESFSNDHLIMDADTRHGIESLGSCGTDAKYKISRDGVCYIFGSGKLKLPAGVNGFSKVVFMDDCTIDTIGKNCFDDCDLITTVILPDTVRTLEDNAFKSCEDLEYVYIPEGCKKIGSQAFDFCDELSYVRVPDSVTSIGDWAFDDCPRLYISVPSELADFSDGYSMKPMYVEKR